MVLVIAGAAFGAFKWMNARETADSNILEWMQIQQEGQEADEVFKEKMMDGIDILVIKTDSSLAIGRENQKAIYANRYTIIKQIEQDTSMTREEAIELMKPFMEGIEDLKKNNGWTHYEH
jgi:hypothetical protein